MSDNKHKRITKRQKDFADNFIKYRNVAKAAEEAGYSRGYALTSGAQRLMNNPLIQAYIERKVSRMDARMVASQEEILYGLTKVFRREETEDVVTTDKEGNVTVTKVRNSVSDSNKAANDLLKIIGHTTSSKMEIAKYRKALADAKLAERKAVSDLDTNVTINVTPWEDKDD